MNTVTRRLDNPVALDVFNDFDNIINGFFRPQRTVSKNGEPMLSLAIDVVEKEDDYEIQADLPGVNKEDINVTLDDGVLTIAAQTATEKIEQTKAKLIRRERRYGKFSRSLKLGNDVDENNIEASYKDGVLKLTLSKAEEIQPKKIVING